jgi:hypothetical protein
MARKLTITSSKVPSTAKPDNVRKIEPFVPEPQEPAELDKRPVKVTKEGVHIGPWTEDSVIKDA